MRLGRAFLEELDFAPNAFNGVREILTFQVKKNEQTPPFGPETMWPGKLPPEHYRPSPFSRG